jgi:hypothetical protein
VAFAEKRSSSIGKSETFLMVSADQNTFVYTVDNSVVCRRTQNLGIKWIRETNQSLTLSRMATSADGDWWLQVNEYAKYFLAQTIAHRCLRC